MNYKNMQWLLDKRPTGMPENECWKLNEDEISEIGKNEILISKKFKNKIPGTKVSPNFCFKQFRNRYWHCV